MKTILAMATIAAIWIRCLSQAPSATVAARPTDPAPLAPPRAAEPVLAPAPAPAPARRIAKAAPSPKPSINPTSIPVAAEECDQWCEKVKEMNRRLSNDLDRYLYEDLKLTVHSLFEIKAAKQEFDDAMERANLIAYAGDDYRQIRELRERLTRERDERIEHALGRDRYDAYRAFLDKQRKERLQELFPTRGAD